MIAQAPSEGRRTGRPLKSEAGPKSAALRFRVREELREQVEAAAVKSGRTISEEAEKRLENSFKLEDLHRLIFDAGPASIFLQKMVSGMMAIHEYEISPGQKIGTSDWEASDATRAAIRSMLQILVNNYIPPPRTPEEISSVAPNSWDVGREQYYNQTVNFMQSMAREMALRMVDQSKDEHQISDPSRASAQ